jgi:hypothetical protein
MSHLIKPVVSRKGRVIVLSGATVWLIAAMLLSATPGDAAVSPSRAPVIATAGAPTVVDQLDGADGLLYSPAIVNSGGQILVTDRSQNRIIRLGDTNTQRPTAAAVFGRQGAGPGEFQLPTGVAVDSQGNVFVVDRILQRITKVRADGTFVKSVVAPGATSVLVDPNDELIVYPVNGKALMQRYSNDLEPGEELFEDTDEVTHRARVGVLMAFDGHGRLVLLDQADLTLTVYDAEMEPITRWEVDAPELRESRELEIRRKWELHPDRGPGFVTGIQAMAVDPIAEQVAIVYVVRREPDVFFSRIAWMSTDGELLATDDRDGLVTSVAFLPDGRLVETSDDALVIRNRGAWTARNALGN